MGNTSCKYMMKNDLRNESPLYKTRKSLYFVITCCIWYFYIQHHYTSYHKWYIMPITTYVTVYLILGMIIHLITEYTMNQYDLNNKIYKCIQWQQFNNESCKNKRLNKCIINPDEVSNWELPQPKPITTEDSTQYNTEKFQYIQPTINSNYSINPTSDIKPMNYFPN